MLNAPRIFEYLRMRIPLAWPAAALTYTRRPVPRLGSEPTCRNSKAASAFVGPANRVLDVAGGLTRGALGFVHFAFSLHLLIAHHLAGRILDRALGLVGRALDVLLVHGSKPSTFSFEHFDPKAARRLGHQREAFVISGKGGRPCRNWPKSTAPRPTVAFRE